MYRFVAHKQMLILVIMDIFILLIGNLCSLEIIIINNRNSGQIIIGIFYFIFINLVCLLSLLWLNRVCSIIWCDGIYIGRRGLLIGYKYKVKIENILKVVPGDMGRIQSIAIIDNTQKRLGFFKYSYIQFERNKKNYEFIKELCKQNPHIDMKI